VRVLMLTEGELPPVALATIVEPDSMPPMAHQGFGCSLSPAHAVVRALTEAAQSRVTDIQGARDDLLRPDDPGDAGAHGRRPRFMPKDRWDVDLPAQTQSLADIADRSSGDLAYDVRVLLDAIERERLGPVIAVDVSPLEIPVSVVRVVAPQFETAVVDGRLGPRARGSFNPFPKAV
jgi:ribosomal protein S12 methylthiotransferase accessory factor